MLKISTMMVEVMQRKGRNMRGRNVVKEDEIEVRKVILEIEKVIKPRVRER